MIRPRFHKAVLFGTGLIGASIGRDLLRLKIASSIVGFDPSRKDLAEAVRLGAVSRTARSVTSELRDADLVIFAAPVAAIRALIRRYASIIPTGALVIDVGSTKAGILKTARVAFPAGNFIGCHPMAGTENSGAAASLVGLFRGKVCFVVSDGSAARMARAASALWRVLGATPIVIAAEAHDRFAAWVSHLPHFAAFALVNAVSGAGLNGVKTFAGGGLRDTTRIAASSPRMWRDIFLENADEVLEAVSGLKRELSFLESALRGRDVAALSRALSKASRARRRIFP